MNITYDLDLLESYYFAQDVASEAENSFLQDYHDTNALEADDDMSTEELNDSITSDSLSRRELLSSSINFSKNDNLLSVEDDLGDGYERAIDSCVSAPVVPGERISVEDSVFGVPFFMGQAILTGFVMLYR